MSDVKIPRRYDLIYPTLAALDQSGGSATIRQLEELVPRIAELTDEQLAVVIEKGTKKGRSQVFYNMDWARTYLKKAGVVDNRKKGVWSITPEGRAYLRMEPLEAEQHIITRAKKAFKAESESKRGKIPRSREAGGADWQKTLLNLLKDMKFEDFEKLIVKLLRETGFVSLKDTKLIRGEGVEGMWQAPLLNMRVYVQCKRYATRVGAGALRKLRMAMAGQGDRGLFITTSTFTVESKEEAARVAPHIDLIDGGELCNLLKKHRLGVKAEERVVEDINVDVKFFS